MSYISLSINSTSEVTAEQQDILEHHLRQLPNDLPRQEPKDMAGLQTLTAAVRANS